MYGVFKNFSPQNCVYRQCKGKYRICPLLLVHIDNISAEDATDYSATPSGF